MMTIGGGLGFQIQEGEYSSRSVANRQTFSFNEDKVIGDDIGSVAVPNMDALQGEIAIIAIYDGQLTLEQLRDAMYGTYLCYFPAFNLPPVMYDDVEHQVKPDNVYSTHSVDVNSPPQPQPNSGASLENIHSDQAVPIGGSTPQENVTSSLTSEDVYSDQAVPIGGSTPQENVTSSLTSEDVHSDQSVTP